MNRPSIFVIRAGKKRLIPYASFDKNESSQAADGTARSIYSARGSFGLIVYKEYQTALAELFVIHLEKVVESFFSFDFLPGSLLLLYSMKGVSRLQQENNREILIAPSQIKCLFPGENSSINLSFGPSRGHGFTIIGIKIPPEVQPVNDLEARLIEYIKHTLAKTDSGSFKQGVLTVSIFLQTAILNLLKALEEIQIQSSLVRSLISIALLEFSNQMKNRVDYEVDKSNVITDEDLAFLIAESIMLEMDETSNIKNLARQNKTNPKKLKVIFKKYVGMPTAAFRISVRMEKAKQLLTDTSLKIQEISALVGYPNPAHFSRIFNQKMGTSPREFRKKLTNHRNNGMQ